ncbi:MAG TPA: putative ABC exporter domain-containing protein [Opitutus sp.]|nr:putative ABC exporter domain-containing protein [Opitutus sp.]
MFGALLYLRLNSLKNLVLSRLRRLRQPKYLVGAIVGAAYFYFVIFRGAGHSHSRGPRPVVMSLDGSSVSAESMVLVLSLGALALLVVFVFMWVLPSQKPGLPFTEAETSFLFPAPVTRRTLIHYKLLSSQLSVLLQSVLFAALFNNRGLVGGRALNVIVGWWLILTLVNLHYMGASLTIAQLVDRGVSTLRRRLAVLGSIAAVAIGAGALVWRDLRAPAPADLANAESVIHWLARILDTGVLHWLLMPFKLVIAPFLAHGARAFLLALGPALLLLALHYLWVVRMNVSFEEASIALAEKRGARRAARRAGNYRAGTPTKGRAPAFRLAARGRPEIAFLWKNLLSAPPLFSARVWLGCAAVIVAGCGILRRGGATPHAILMTAGIVALFVGAYTLALGPLVARIDLRNDLPNSDVLKTYPLPGWQVVLGELLAPVAILTGIVWLALLLAACGLQPTGKSAQWLTPDIRVALAVCIAAVTPPLVALQLLVPNAAAILFPGWVQTVRTPGGGIDLMGQRLIFVFGQVFTILVALIPAALTAGLLVFVTQWLIGPPAAIGLATLVVIAVIAGEVACGVWWLGGRFERFDLSSELRP